jgi:hypothetical protein
MGEQPSFASGAAAKDLTEVKAGALECLEGSRIQKWQWKAADSMQKAKWPSRNGLTTLG